MSAIARPLCKLSSHRVILAPRDCLGSVCHHLPGHCAQHRSCRHVAPGSVLLVYCGALPEDWVPTTACVVTPTARGAKQAEAATGPREDAAGHPG